MKTQKYSLGLFTTKQIATPTDVHIYLPTNDFKVSPLPS